MFGDMSPQAWKTKTNTNKWEYGGEKKKKTFCTAKETINKTK